MPSTTSWVVYGLMKLAVPTETAVAPAIINSRASSALAIPPIPMIGIFTAFATWYTMRTATGFTAGPDIPPVLLARAKVLRLISIFIPVMVLIRETTSAPPLSAARAISVMSVTLGLSFMITGCLAYFFTSFVIASSAFGFWPKAMPPSFTLGQDTLISSISTGSLARRSTTSQ